MAIFSEERDQERQRRGSQSRIFFETKDEAFIHKQNSKKTNNSSRMGEFNSPEAIQLSAKFALGSSLKKNSLNGYF